jgi:hypothetical protein
VDVQLAESGSTSRAIDNLLHAFGRYRPAALGTEDIFARVRAFALEATQGANLDPAQAMIAAQAVLEADDVEEAMLEVELRPAEPGGLADALSVGERHE